MAESQCMNYINNASQNFIPYQNAYIGRRTLMPTIRKRNQDCIVVDSNERLANQIDFSPLISKPIQKKINNDKPIRRFEVKVKVFESKSVKGNKKIIRPKSLSRSRSRSRSKSKSKRMKISSIKRLDRKSNQIQEEQCSIEEDEEENKQYDFSMEIAQKANIPTQLNHLRYHN